MRHAVTAALLVLAASSAVASEAGPRTLTFDDRIAAQKAIEQVYWSHRTWPKENPAPKPPLSAVMSDELIRAKVEDYLKKSNALETWWQRPITGEQLQAEMDRMAKGSRDPQVLQELFAALGNDPRLIAETLARQTLVDRLIRNWYASDTRFHAETRATAEAALTRCSRVDCMKSMGGDYRATTFKLRNADVPRALASPDGSELLLDSDGWSRELERLASKFGAIAESMPERRLSELDEMPDSFSISALLSRTHDEITTAAVVWPKRPFDAWWAAKRGTPASDVTCTSATFTLPVIFAAGCANDTWFSTFVVPSLDNHAAVWTGTEMIVWGGDTGGRYSPSTDSWTGTSTDVSGMRPYGGTAVWTGTELIVWGGGSTTNAGWRYNTTTGIWSATSTGTNAPEGRSGHVAVWTGTEMIIWGGRRSAPPTTDVVTGGRYDPSTDSWTTTSTAGAVPSGREFATAVWTGNEMIVWGGVSGLSPLNTGGRYNPSTNTWTATSTGANAPSVRQNHTAVWTGTEMIVWGGHGSGYLNTGGRYSPSTDSWMPTSTTAPSGRESHTAVWTGAEMIVWGGDVFVNGNGYTYLNSGGRYQPSTNTWTATSTGTNVPVARRSHSAVWTGHEMIVWGGASPNSDLNTGARYSPSTDSWTPTSTNGGVPTNRDNHTAVWTGNEMIVWGGLELQGVSGVPVNTGGCYHSATDSWTPTSTASDDPSARAGHTAVWTGREMIVWGAPDSSGGRYNPITDSWVATSLGANVPAGRGLHTAVWTGTEMIVWGGLGASTDLNDGARYEPTADRWTPISGGATAPASRWGHSSQWTGTKMIVWGGYTYAGGGHYLNTGGLYDPNADSWLPTSTGTSTPEPRASPSAVWTGTEMIVWGGTSATGGLLNTGGRYVPFTDSWAATSTGANVPAARDAHTAVWTGAEMIVWGGVPAGGSATNSGGRYSPSTDTWTATSTAAGVPVGLSGHTAVWTGSQMIVWGGSSNAGGRYCACSSGRLVYRDLDGDGYGDPSVSMSSCDGSVPLGYASNGTDCNDDDPSVYPSAPEINDGIDNQCPGDAGYGVLDEISGVSGFSTLGDKARFSWASQSGAVSYDVVRSTTPDFSGGCTLYASSQPFIVDIDLPTDGSAFYYLVRPSAPHVGSWGQNGDGTPRAVSCFVATGVRN